MSHARTVLTLAAAAFALLLAADPAAAQGQSEPPPAAGADAPAATTPTPTITPAPAAAPSPAARTTAPGKAEQSLKRGIEAYKKNSFASAVGAFSTALSSGGLDSKSTARALYYRGMSYRKQGRSALALTDLNNALWLKNGLDETERADAMQGRAAAYKDAGIADPGIPDDKGASSAAAEAPAAAASAEPQPSTPAAHTNKSRKSADASPTETTASEAAPAAAPPEQPAQSAAPPTTRSRKSADAADAAEKPAGTTSAEGESSTAGNSASQQPTSGIGNFFNKLFSGGSSEQGNGAATGDSVTTSSTGDSAAVSSWSSATETGQGKTKSASPATNEAARAKEPAAKRTAALKTPEASETAQAAPQKGKYRLRIGAVRSRAEAEQIAQRITSEHAATVGDRSPSIEEAVFGNMGTFYRVNIGPYASAAELTKLCQTVRSSGIDCMVVDK